MTFGSTVEPEFNDHLTGNAIRPYLAMALTKVQEDEMEGAELKMLQFSLGVTRIDKIRMSTSEGQHR